MNITQVQTLTVPVSDQDRAKDFYVGTLGFEVVADNQAGPMRWLQVVPAGGDRAGAGRLAADPDGNGFVLLAS